MALYALKLRLGGIIPPAINVGIELKREPKPVTITKIIEVPVEPEPEVETLPAGGDVWYDAPEIPFRQIDGEVLPDTSNVGFGYDDSVDYEGDYIQGDRSAWWKLTVPPGVVDAVLTADTWLTVPAPTSSAVPVDGDPDTIIRLVSTDEAPPLPALPSGETDFSTFILDADSDDDPDPDGDNYHLSKITEFPLTEGRVYWLRVSMYADDASGTFYDTLYKLRISLTFTPA